MFLFARVSGLFYYHFAVFRKGVFITKLNAVLLLALVRHKSIICQNLVILIKLDVPCGVIFIFEICRLFLFLRYNPNLIFFCEVNIIRIYKKFLFRVCSILFHNVVARGFVFYGCTAVLLKANI